MNIAIAQVASHKADIAANLVHHARLIELAAAHEAQLLVFPELSLSQYDPLIVEAVATTVDDPRFGVLQTLAEAHALTIGVGVPLRTAGGITISLLIFQPGQPVAVYDKRYLHADEVPYFVPGFADTALPHADGNVAFAICYELSIPQHAADAHAGGAAVYIASVAKTPRGVVGAAERLAAIAREYGMTVFMSNCVGECEGSPAGGKSAIWGADGEPLASLDDTGEGLLIYDPAMPQVAPRVVPLEA